MRTKALLLGAMIGAVSLASSMAQVYSVNIVGYVNTTVYNGFTMIQNPLNNTAGNTLDNVLPTFSPAPTYVRLYKWNPLKLPVPGYDVNIWADGWDVGTMVINPGEGFFLYNPGPDLTVTFVGEVMTGELSLPVYQGFNMVGSQVPQTGLLTTELNYQPSGVYERVYDWNPLLSPPDYQIYMWTAADGWDPEPTVGVGKAVFVYRTTAESAWTRLFNVGP